MIASSQKIEIDGHAQKRLDTRTKKKKKKMKTSMKYSLMWKEIQEKED